MAKSGRIKTARVDVFGVRGSDASRLRRRKYSLIRTYGFPEGILGGSLNQVFRRCGKEGCHCASSEGHPRWTLTYSIDAVKHVESIPTDLVKVLKPLLKDGKAYQDAIREVRGINAQLLTLWKRAQKK